MAFDGNKPAVTEGKVSLLQSIRNNFNRAVTLFQGGSGDSNIPTNAKRIDNNGNTYYWNGSSWVSVGKVAPVTTTAEINTGTSTAERVVTPALLKHSTSYHHG